jgi:hypothetical protein
MNRKSVPDDARLTVRIMAEELVRRVESGALDFEALKPHLQALIRGEFFALDAEKDATPKHDRAADLAYEQQEWWDARGFTDVVVPVPDLSNRAVTNATRNGIAHIFIPSVFATRAGYARFMRAVDQGDHWTVTDEEMNKKIKWPLHDADTPGIWLLVEATPECPRTRTSRSDIVAAFSKATMRLLWLHEYVVVWHLLKSNDIVLDVRTWCWLANAYGSGALDANGYDGRLDVSRDDAASLASGYECEGGRGAEVVSLRA